MSVDEVLAICGRCKGTGIVQVQVVDEEEQGTVDITCPTCDGVRYVARSTEPPELIERPRRKR